MWPTEYFPVFCRVETFKNESTRCYEVYLLNLKHFRLNYFIIIALPGWGRRLQENAMKGIGGEAVCHFSEPVFLFLLIIFLFSCRLMKILALYQKQYKAEHLVSIHLPMYQQKGSSFRVVFWKLGTMQHWIKTKKRFDPSILAHGIRCCIKSGKKMWRFHLESQKSPNEVKMASGCEWEWVAKCNEKLHTECLFRLFKEKGLQVKDLQCLRRNNDLLEQLGGNAVLPSSSLVSIRE